MIRFRPLAAGLLAAATLLTPVSTAGAQTRDDVVIGIVLEPPHLDPTAGAAAAIDEIVYANVFEGLTKIEADGSITPLLATSWETSADGLVWTFDLADGVTFSDETPFTAETAVFSLDRARADESENAQKGLFSAIAGVEAVDDDTLRITLSRPEGNLLFNLGWGDAVMVSPDSAETNKSEPVGTGPFTVERWVKGDRIALARRDDYWGEAPALARATFRIIPDPATAVTNLMSGDVDAFPNIPAPESILTLEADPRFSAVVGTTEGETILAMNNTRAPLDDVRVRRAIAKAIDRQAIVDGAMFGLGTPIGSHFAPHHPAYADLTDVNAYDPDGARALLAEAGVETLTLSLKLPPPVYARRGGEIVAAQLRAVGIETEIVPLEWAGWLEQVFTNKDFDLTIVSHTEPLDIGIYARDDYYFGYRSQAFDAVMAELEATSDPAARDALYAQAQTILAEEAPNAFLFQLAKAGVAAAGLEGLWENAPVQANDLTDARWAE
ncbi:MAG: ABC transporter substrate-binding protein [Pseudomonadota bacterium]